MPTRIQPNRPVYITRPVLPRAASQARGGRGAVPPGGVDTASTGNVGGDLARAIANVMIQNRQNAVANQLMNIRNPPRAEWVGGAAPAAGVPTAGTAPQTGGMGELQVQDQIRQEESEARKQALADRLTEARIAAANRPPDEETRQAKLRYLEARTKKLSEPGKPGKPGKYEPGSIDPMTDPNADKLPHVAADFDATFGNGSFAKVAPNLANATQDEKGNYLITNAKGDVIMTLPPDKAQYWFSRYNAGLVASGQQPIMQDKFPTANPNSGKPAGSETNPYKPSNQLEARSLPYNSFFVDPGTGQIGQKLPEEKATTGPAPKTTQTDTGETGSATPDLGDGGLGDEDTGDITATTDTGSNALADAIRRARAQDQLRGIA